MWNAWFSEVLQWCSPPVIPPMGQSCSKYTSLFSASSNPSIRWYLHFTNLTKISHLTCNPHIFSHTFLTVFSLSKKFQKPKNVGQKSWVDILPFFLLTGISSLSKPTVSYFSLFKISISGCFVTDNSFNKQNSHTVTLNIKRLSPSHSQSYDFPSLTMLVSILK